MAELARPIRSARFFAHNALIADGLAVALAATLPWSTSATGILAGLWLLVVIPALDAAVLRRVLSTPAGGLPVMLWALGLVGMLWAGGLPFAERLDGLNSYHKLLFIPLLMTHFHRSERGSWAMGGFLASCGVLLALSWTLFMIPSLPLPWTYSSPGVPVKDYIAQGAEFTVCVFLLAALALEAWRNRRQRFALALLALLLIFLANILCVLVSRTALVAVPILLLLFACRRVPWQGAIGLLLAGLVLGALAWSFTPDLRRNVTGLFHELREFRPDGLRTRAGARLEFWWKSIGFVAAAPLIGHGTGSVHDQFRRSAEGRAGAAAVASANPHNQTLAVAVQLGIVGTAVLFAMWLSHLLLFRGDSLAAWAGLVIVTQNIVGSLFNSHLFDFTHGWGYVIGVGVAGGMIFRNAVPPRPGRPVTG